MIGDAFTGQPMQLPVVDIVEVGAGGGSIAWCDAARRPSCRAGQRRRRSGPRLLRPRRRAADGHRRRFVARPAQSMRVFSAATCSSIAAAPRAVLGKLGDKLGLDAAATAAGIVTIVDSAMSLAVRAVSIKRGIDPRETTLIAFGGAGPLHAVAIAREISIPRVVIPKFPGAFSALGMLMAQWRQDFVRTLIGELGKVDPGLAKTGLRRIARPPARRRWRATSLTAASLASPPTSVIAGRSIRYLSRLRRTGSDERKRRHTSTLQCAA